MTSAALLWPGASRSFFVDSTGDLYNGEWKVHVAPSVAGGIAGGSGPMQSDLDGTPILTWQRVSGPVRWSFEAVALGAPCKDGVAISLEIRAFNGSASAQTVELRTSFQAPSTAPPFVAADMHRVRTLPGWCAPTGTSMAGGWSSGAVNHQTATIRWALHPGETKSASLALTSHRCDGRKLRRWALVGHQQRVREARAYWNTRFSQGLQLQLNDAAVEAAFHSSIGVLLGCTERRGSRLVSLGNPFQYRDVWIRDGARCMAALALAGQETTARELARSLLDYQWPQGAFLSQRGQLDGTGQALWAFEQVLLRCPADSSLGEFVDAAVAGWRWCEGQRAASQILGLPFDGLMPYCEPHDAELQTGRGQLVGTDAWALVGYRSAERLLLAAGRRAESRRVGQARGTYAAKFDALLSQCPSPGIPPTWDGSGLDWGNASVAYPCEVLPALHPRCIALAERMLVDPDDGLVHYGGSDSLHTYLSADLAHWALLAGRPETTERVLHSLLRWRTASGGSPELFARARRDFGTNLPPHGTAAAAIVMLVRNCLIFDDGDSLRLTLGAQRAWWAHSTVKQAPTRWGRIDLEFHADADSAHWTWTPVPVPTELTLPPGAEALPPSTGAPYRRLSPSRVAVAANIGEVTVRFRRTHQ